MEATRLGRHGPQPLCEPAKPVCVDRIPLKPHTADWRWKHAAAHGDRDEATLHLTDSTVG